MKRNENIHDEPLVVFENVSFAYNGNTVLENVSLTVVKNELISIVGPNGGGKTTLLMLVLGRLKPSSGRILVFGKETGHATAKTGYMPQYMHFDPQFPATVMDVVLMGRVERRLLGRYTRTDKDAALQALAELDMEATANRSFSELSGGQRQRVLIARALVSEPELLLLDEPTSNVDSKTEHKLVETLDKLNKRMTIMLVSHDLAFVSNIVKTVICVNREVVVHPTTEITGEIIQEIYGTPVKMVRHDHRYSETGHST